MAGIPVIMSRENYYKTLYSEFIPEDLIIFIENEDWYKKKGLPYHYGILLHGEPGCGKTSIIKATLKEIDRNAISISLNGIELKSSRVKRQCKN
jgi:chaperone BCS1